MAANRQADDARPDESPMGKAGLSRGVETKTEQKRPKPENGEAADKATQDNDLTTGHSDPDDGGADNASANK